MSALVKADELMLGAVFAFINRNVTIRTLLIGRG